MVKKLILLLLTVFPLGLFSQQTTLQLTFKAIKNTIPVTLDRVKVMNRSQGGATTIYWPDSTLTLSLAAGDTLLYIGYSNGYTVTSGEIHTVSGQFRLFQNHPNPINGMSLIPMYVPEKGSVNIRLTDMQGQVVENCSWLLDKGSHAFRIIPNDAGLFFLTARWNGESRSIKILSMTSGVMKGCILDHAGTSTRESLLKTSSNQMDVTVMESGILDNPVANESYTFQFATNIPCPETPTVTYEGTVYNTIQIFSQCWLKENLNAGSMINVNHIQTNNGMKEKYCYSNNPDSCAKYGGLYQWDEMMQYTTQQGVQGLCPAGWHLPTDDEWKVLEGAVDSQHEIGNPEWDLSDIFRGFDVGANLKTTAGWYTNGNGTDLYGFSGLPGGHSYATAIDTSFSEISHYGYWWTSTKTIYNDGFYRPLFYYSPKALRSNTYRAYGLSVRCLKDN